MRIWLVNEVGWVESISKIRGQDRMDGFTFSEIWHMCTRSAYIHVFLIHTHPICLMWCLHILLLAH
jgi:hypothetical protein